MMIFLLLPLLGIAYIAWHVWCLLPCAWWWKLLDCLACLVPVAVCVVVETISNRIADRLVPNHDVWYARPLRQHAALGWHCTL